MKGFTKIMYAYACTSVSMLSIAEYCVIIWASQDPLGIQGVRVRGDASECQVWLRHLDNGDELYVVLFNSGKGSCAPSVAGGNATMTVTWPELGVPPECMLSTSELISGVYMGSLQQQVSVSIREGASAALRMHPHCHLPVSPPPPSPV
jgi:hypothetical protein